MATEPLAAIRDIALAFPDAVETESYGQVAFRVHDKIFVSFSDTEDGTHVCAKCAPGQQEPLIKHGDPFFLPEYTGRHGWIGVNIDDETDWNEVGDLVIDSYREVAPRSLSQSIGIRPEGRSLGAEAMVRVGSVIGELIEGKPPKDEVVAEQRLDDEEDDDGLLINFDPDDPMSTSVQL